MENTVIEEIKQALREFIAPQIEGLRGDVRALETKFDAKFELLDAKIGNSDTKSEVRFQSLDMKIESVRRELLAEIRRVEGTLSTDFVRFESNFDLRLAALEKKIN